MNDTETKLLIFALLEKRITLLVIGEAICLGKYGTYSLMSTDLNKFNQNNYPDN